VRWIILPLVVMAPAILGTLLRLRPPEAPARTSTEGQASLFFRAFFLTVIDYRQGERAAAVIDYRRRALFLTGACRYYRRRQRISAGACRYYRRREFSKAGSVLADFL